MRSKLTCEQDLEKVKKLLKTEKQKPPCDEKDQYNWDKVGPDIDHTKLCALGKQVGKKFVDICNVRDPTFASPTSREIAAGL